MTSAAQPVSARSAAGHRIATAADHAMAWLLAGISVLGAGTVITGLLDPVR